MGASLLAAYTCLHHLRGCRVSEERGVTLQVLPDHDAIEAQSHSKYCPIAMQLRPNHAASVARLHRNRATLTFPFLSMVQASVSAEKCLRSISVFLSGCYARWWWHGAGVQANSGKRKCRHGVAPPLVYAPSAEVPSVQLRVICGQ